MQKTIKSGPTLEGERKPPASSVREAPALQPQDTAVPMTDDDIEGLPDISQETAPDSMVEDYSGTTSATRVGLEET